ncbi:MAG: tetratricopeptide repeat protein, partial [Bradymonadaceae bacterium]
MATPIAIGGVHSVVAAALVGVGLLAWALQLAQPGQSHGEGETGRVFFSIPSLGLWLFALLCLIQVLPLPPFFHSVLNPLGLEHFSSSWQAVFSSAEPSGLRALSLDPSRTADYGLRWMALAIFAALAANMGFRSTLWRRLLWTMIIAGAAVWGIGLVQHFMDLDLFLGFYKAEIHITSTSTFVNKNHAAVFFGLVSLAAFALTMQEYRARPWQAIGASFAGTVALVVMATSDSDGTFLAYLLGLSFLVGAISLRMGLAQKAAARLRELQPAQWAALGTAVGVGMLFIVFLIGPETFKVWFWESSFGEWLFDKGRVRYLMSKAAVLGGLDFWRLGGGAGSMELGLAPYLDWTELRAATVSTVENETADWFFSFGVLPTLLTCLLFSTGLYFSGRHLSHFEHRSRYIVVFSFAIFMLVIVFFHFPFLTLGISLPFVVLFEGGISRRYKKRRRKSEEDDKTVMPGHLSISRRAAWGLWAVAAAASVLLGFLHFRAYAVDYDAVFSEDGGYDPAGVERIVRLQPTDSQLLTRLAIAARTEGDYARSAELAARAFEVRPTNRQLLFLARSRALAQDTSGAVEAYQELFGDYASQHARWVNLFMLKDLRAPADRAAALQRASPLWWNPAARTIQKDEGLTAAVDFALELIDRHPDQAEAYLTVIDVYVRAQDPDLAELWARQLIGRQLIPTDARWPAGYGELVDLLISHEREEEAWKILRIAAQADFADDGLAARVLRLAPSPAEIDEERSALLDYAHKTYCAS